MDITIIWGLLIAVALAVYMLLDGFDLGVGILYPFAPTTTTRDHMMNSIAPIWDTNETWLVLAGGGLYGVFPKAYVFIFNALYIPLIGMLICLIFRGISFEFRFKASPAFKYIWSFTFFLGSLGAAFFQGVILGQLIYGFTPKDGAFNGDYWAWCNDFTLMFSLLVIGYYILMGATFLIYRLEGAEKKHFMKSAKITLWTITVYAIALLMLVYALYKMGDNSPAVFPALSHLTANLKAHYAWCTGLILIILLVAFRTSHNIQKHKRDWEPFMHGALLLILVFALLILLGWPYVVPGVYTIWQASSQPETQKLMLIGALIFLPLIFGYSIYNFYIFHGKVSNQNFYH